MKNDFDMIVETFPEREDITIIPVADLHIGAPEHNEKAWTDFVWRVAETPNLYIVLVGDLINNATKTSVSNVYTETMRPREQKKLIAEQLMPIRDKILAMVSGNHERRTTKDVDQDVTYDIACKLDLEDSYRENIAFLKIRIGDSRKSGTDNPTYIFGITHGAGSSIYTTAASVRAERFGMAIDGIDCLITGHTHKSLNAPIAKIAMENGHNRAVIKQFRLVTATSWLGYSAYAARKLLAPTAYMLQEITICGKKKELTVRG